MGKNVRYAVNRPDVIDEAFDGEFVVVNLRSGSYYALKETAAVIWRELKTGASVQQIATALGERYSGADGTIEKAVEELVHELQQETLIVPHPDENGMESPRAATEQPTAAVQGTFPAPVLEKFTDMREVLQLDPIHEVDDSGWPSRKE